VAVLFEHRAADGYDRMKVINSFVDHVPRPPHTVKLKGAAKTISVQVRCACAAPCALRAVRVERDARCMALHSQSVSFGHGRPVFNAA